MSASPSAAAAAYPISSYQVFPGFQSSSLTFLLSNITSGTIAIPIPAAYLIQANIDPNNLPVIPVTTNPDFTFAVTGPAPYTAQVTLQANNMWKTDPTSRSQLMQNFVNFLISLEAFELASPPVLVSGTTYRIGQMIADSVPAPLLESIFYRYSFYPGFASNPMPFPATPFVDIRAGMRLRVETQASQLVAAGAPINGYIAGGQSIFRVNTVSPNGGGRVVGFDPFLGTINCPTVTGSTSTGTVVAGGLVDLQQAANGGSYVRLFFPSSVPGPTSPGSTSPGSNPSLVTTKSLSAMNTVVTQGIGQAPLASLFLGRAIAIPEIPVTINVTTPGTSAPPTQEYLPIGTTVANIIERYCPVALVSGSGPAVKITRYNTVSSVVMLLTFALPGKGSAIVPGTFDLPLIAGDILQLTFTNAS